MKYLLVLILSFVIFGTASVIAAPSVGVSNDPCREVPIEATAVHQAASNPYEQWMRDWLSLDWGQRCRYAVENAALPKAPHSRVIFLGDSITEGWKSFAPTLFAGDTLNRGISGQTTEQMLVRLRTDVIDLHPTVLHIMAGTNDIAGNIGPTSLAHIQGNIATIVELARAHGIAIVLASIPPAASFWWRPELRPSGNIALMNQWLRGYAAREHLVYADYYGAIEGDHGGLKPEYSDDGAHPNAAGYAVMTPIARASIRKALGASSSRPTTSPAASPAVP